MDPRDVPVAWRRIRIRSGQVVCVTLWNWRSYTEAKKKRHKGDKSENCRDAHSCEELDGLRVGRVCGICCSPSAHTIQLGKRSGKPTKPFSAFYDGGYACIKVTLASHLAAANAGAVIEGRHDRAVSGRQAARTLELSSYYVKYCNRGRLWVEILKPSSTATHWLALTWL